MFGFLMKIKKAKKLKLVGQCTDVENQEITSGRQMEQKVISNPTASLQKNSKNYLP